MRRHLLLAGFVLSAAVLLGALAWISHLTVDLEAREQDARQHAAFEERVRLSLWRMDAAVASLLAQENARAVEPITPAASIAPAEHLAPVASGASGAPFRPVAPATPATPATPAAPAGAVDEAASGPPLAAEMTRPYLVARFEVGPGGDVREWSTARRAQGPVAAPLERDILLAGLRQGPLATRPQQAPEPGEPKRRTGAIAAAPQPRPAQRQLPETTATASPRTEQASGAGAASAAAQQKTPQSASAESLTGPSQRKAAQAASTASPAAPSRLKTAPQPASATAPQDGQLKTAQPSGASDAHATLKTPPPKQAAPAAESEPPSVQSRQARAEPGPASAANDPVVREMANQQKLNQAEFDQRLVQNQAYEPQAAAPPAVPPAAAAQTKTSFPGASPASSAPSVPSPSSAFSVPSTSSPPPGPSAPSAGSSPAPSSSAPPAAAPSRPSSPSRPPGQAPPRRRPPGASASAAPPGRALGTVAAVWVGDDLVLARRVARGGEELLQGARLDGRGTREWLAAQVGDLLPRAALFPLLPGETADPGRRLALLPLRLDAGPLPAAPAAGESPVRLGLAVASAAVLLSLAAAGLQLAATQRLARRRADFVSAVTHELRTPLTTFRLYTEMLAGDMVPTGERPAYLGTLRAEADRLGHLVENVLAFARMERGRGRSKVETVELAPLLAEAVALLAPRVERDGATLAAELPPEAAAARVRVDRVAVARILQNLADNACKYGRNPADPRLHLTVQLRDRRAVITLRDHGPGLDRRGRRRLFHPFHRSAEQATGEAPGVGLGLALSRRLARDFGGDLRAVDPADGGAAFELALPLAS